MVHDYGAGASLEITGQAGASVLVPFTAACVPTVDIAAGRADRGDAGRDRRSAGSGASRMTWRASVLTLFPAMFPGPLGQSLAGRALETGIWSLDVTNIRDFARTGTAPSTTRRSAAAPAWCCGRTSSMPRCTRWRMTGRGLPDPTRPPLHPGRCPRVFAGGPGVILLCGRYEGIDQRVIEARGMQEFSIGDYVLSGGELAALVLLDSVVRLLPGVMGAAESAIEESFSTGLLEYPHYTRPAEWQGRRVPDVLLSGHHGAVAAWRQAEVGTHHPRAPPRPLGCAGVTEHAATAAS